MRRKKRYLSFKVKPKNLCIVCRNKISKHLINYLNLPLLRIFLNQNGSLKTAQRNCLCNAHQTHLESQIKTARSLHFIPYVVYKKMIY